MRTNSSIPMAAWVILFLNGVSGLASHRMNTLLNLACHQQRQSPLTSSPLSYATDSTNIGSNVQTRMPQNFTIPLLLADEDLFSQVKPSTPATTTRTKKNILRYAWRKIKGSMKINKENIAKMGVDFMLTYNMVSNINGSITLSSAWYIASMKSGLSPLAPGNWRSLLAAYAGLYVVVALIRPLRIALAISGTGKMERLLQYMQERKGYSRRSAIVTVFGVGLLVWMGLGAAGVTLASALSGVPIWKYHA